MYIFTYIYLYFSIVAVTLNHMRGTELVLENSALLSHDLMSGITMWLQVCIPAHRCKCASTFSREMQEKLQGCVQR